MVIIFSGCIFPLFYLFFQSVCFWYYMTLHRLTTNGLFVNPEIMVKYWISLFYILNEFLYFVWCKKLLCISTHIFFKRITENFIQGWKLKFRKLLADKSLLRSLLNRQIIDLDSLHFYFSSCTIRAVFEIRLSNLLARKLQN